MRRSTLYLAVQTCLAIVGTGAAFAFLEAGAFTGIGAGTLQRMVEPASLQSAAIGASVTAVLLAPYLVWQARRCRFNDPTGQDGRISAGAGRGNRG